MRVLNEKTATNRYTVSDVLLQSAAGVRPIYSITKRQGGIVDSSKKYLSPSYYKTYNTYIQYPSHAALIRHPIPRHNHPLLQRLRLLLCNRQRIIKSLDDLLIQPIPDILSL